MNFKWAFQTLELPATADEDFQILNESDKIWLLFSSKNKNQILQVTTAERIAERIFKNCDNNFKIKCYLFYWNFQKWPRTKRLKPFWLARSIDTCSMFCMQFWFLAVWNESFESFDHRLSTTVSRSKDRNSMGNELIAIPMT